MSERHAFIKACHDNRDDDTSRLVFADWLDDRNDNARAELIRVQVELARSPFGDGPVRRWQEVWREGFVPVLPPNGIKALREALMHDDPRLVQGITTSPPPLHCVRDWPVEAADVIGYCGWKGSGLKTVAEVEEFFSKACYNADQKLGEPAACRWFLNWFDDTPRDVMRRELLSEIDNCRDAWLLQTIEHLHRLDQVRGEVVAPDDVRFMDRGLVDEVWIEWKHWLTVADETWEKELPRLVRIIGDVPEMEISGNPYLAQYTCHLVDRPAMQVYFTQLMLNGAAMVPGMDGLRELEKDVMVQLLEMTWPDIKFEVAGQIEEPFANINSGRRRPR